MVRQFFVFIHRWAGLAMTVFLILVGLTGSMLAFKTDIERLICPRIYATPRPGVAPLDIATLAERAQTPRCAGGGRHRQRRGTRSGAGGVRAARGSRDRQAL